MVKLLTSDEILAMSEGLKDAADDHREVQDTDDKYSILKLEWIRNCHILERSR